MAVPALHHLQHRKSTTILSGGTVEGIAPTMSEAPTPQPDTQPDTSSGLTFFGWCVLGLGLTGLGLSFTVDIGVSVDGLGAVANLDKLSLRELMVQISLGLTLVGTIFASAGHIITAVRTGPLPRP